MPQTFRILPTLMVVLVLFFGVKVAGLWTGYQAISEARASSAGDSHASGGHEAKAPESKGHEPEGHGEDEAGHGDTHKPEPAKAADRITRQPIPGELGTVSAAEVEVLESLSARRGTLDKRAAELDMRENLLAATERRIDDKIAELKTIEARIQSSLTSLDSQEDEQIKSLVKVYESMKPKDAAPILQSLDRPILIQVVSRMKEAKMAAILAQMEPKVAREVTVLLATRTEIPGRDGVN